MNQTERPAAVSAAPPAAVLDTNAVLDWLVFQDPGITALAAAVEAAAVRWIASPHMREELLRALSYSALAKWKPDCERTLTAFDQWAIICAEPLPTREGPLVCSDPEDQVFIDLALSTAGGDLNGRPQNVGERAVGRHVVCRTADSHRHVGRGLP